MTKSWTFRRRSDVERFWREVRDVPRRTNGRKHSHEERYCLGLYLLALATHEMLEYPLRVEPGESPDFMLTWKSGETTGLEVKGVTQSSLRSATDQAERESALGAFTAGRIEPKWNPALFDRAEREWCLLVRRTIERGLSTLSGSKASPPCHLLIYDETPLPVVDRRKVLGEMDLWVRAFRGTNGSVPGKISVIVSLDVAFDLGGTFRIFPFVEWADPQLDNPKGARDFAERAEYAARKAAEVAVKGRPAYFEDNRGRIVKRTLEGRRFEVRPHKGSGEVVVRELVRD